MSWTRICDLIGGTELTHAAALLERHGERLAEVKR